MIDLATLGIVIDASQIPPAVKKLDDLTKAGEKTETQTKKTTKATTELADAIKKSGGEAASSGKKATDEIGKGMEHAAGMTNRARSEIIVLAHEMIQGRFSRIPGSLMVLAESSGAAGHAIMALFLNPVTLGILALVAVLAILGKAWSEGEAEVNKFNNQMRAMNNYLGLSYGQVHQFAEAIGKDAQAGISKATAALDVLVNSGHASRETLFLLADAAVRLGQLTGESADKIAEDFLKMDKGVTAYAVTFQDKYHLLNAALVQYVDQLEKTGQQEEAAKQLSIQIHEAIRAKGVAELGLLSKAWRDFGLLMTTIWENMKSIGRSAPLESELIQAQEKLATAKASLPTTITPVGTNLVIKAEEDHIARLQVQIAAQTVVNTQQAEYARRQTEGVDALGRMNTQWKQYKHDVNAAQQAIDAYEADIARMKAAGMTTPTPTEIAQTEAHIRKSLDPDGAAATRKAAQADKEAARTAAERAHAISDVNLKLDNQLDLMGYLGDARRDQEAYDRIEEGLASRKITLTGQEVTTLKAKIAAVRESLEVDKTANSLYEELQAPLREHQIALAAIAELQRRVTDGDLDSNAVTAEQIKLLKERDAIRYAQATDPLYNMNRNLDEQIKLLRLAIPQREIEAAVDQAVYEAKLRMLPLTDKAIQQLRDKLALQIQLSKYDSLRNQAATAGVGAATNAASGILTHDSVADRQRAAYAEIDAMRKADVIVEGQALRAKAILNEQYQQERLGDTREFLGNLATLASSSNKTLAAIGKAAAITQATIDGILAVQKTLGAYPFPINIAMAAAVGVATAVNIAKIAGMANGGIVTGPGGPRDDKVPIWASNGEFVVNAAATARNRAALEAMNRGGSPAPAARGAYANGGLVGNSGGGGDTNIYDFRNADFSGSDPAETEKRIRMLMEHEYKPEILRTAQATAIRDNQGTLRQKLNGGRR